MRRLAILLLVVFCSISVVYAQSNKFNSQFETFKNERTKKYQNFRDKANADFAKFLEERWKEFEASKPQVPPISVVLPEPVVFDPVDDPKPQPITVSVPILDLDEPIDDLISTIVETPEPIIDDKQLVVKPIEVPAKPEEPVVAPTPVTPPAPIVPTTPVIRRSANDKLINYFSESIYIPWNFKKSPTLNDINEKAFARFWKQLSEDSNPTVESLSLFAKEKHLNGWACYELVRKFSEVIYPENRPDERIGLQVYLLSQLEFRAKAAVCGSRLVLLLPFNQKVYSVPYLNIDGIDYFIYSYGHDGTKGFRTYAKDFAAANQNLNLAMRTPINIGESIEVKLPRWSEILGEEFSAKVSKGQVDFEFDYPIVDPEIFYNQGVPNELAAIVLPKLKEKIKGMNEEQSVAYILKLVQDGFEYMTDNDAFGRQKQLFIEESFYYGRNNCKDRVNIFSWLVRELVGLDVVFVFYEGTPKSGGVAHIACAVGFNDQNIIGDAYILGDKRYVVCDPTYINAYIGQTMSYYDVEKGQIRLYYKK